MRLTKSLLCIIVFVLPIVLFAYTNDKINYLPGLGKPQQVQYSGYVSARKADCHHQSCVRTPAIFYWYVAANKKSNKSPVIVWASGGPGSSSLYGFFMEVGPYSVAKHGILHHRKYAWNHFSNLLILDQPLGVGLSFVKKSLYPKAAAQGNKQYYFALQHFFARHSKLRSHPLYLSGESYAGTYIALLLKTIVQQNKLYPNKKLDLKGIILVSGWVDPILQQSKDAQYAYNHGLITQAQKSQIDNQYRRCQNLSEVKDTTGSKTYRACSNIGDMIAQISKLNLHDISNKPLVSDKLMTAYLNRKNVRRAIHAKIGPTYSDWTNLAGYYNNDLETSYRASFQQLLNQGVKILLFSGLNDASDCNFLGISLWLRQMHWIGEVDFWQSNFLWKMPHSKKVLAYIQCSGHVTWIKVLHSGHMVPLDQPKIAILVKDFVN